ncbi:hypothetical protein QYE76_020658 [Lolium multiflorum]|nr:hypothetical protein QYE76_020658 [Lolium multiflorum]
MGWGAVFRDHCGAFILSCSEGLTGFPTPEMAEALAIRRALSVSKERGFQKIILVSDCLSLIQRISSTARDRSTLGIIVGDIKTLKTDFQGNKGSDNGGRIGVHTSVSGLQCGRMEGASGRGAKPG